MDLQGSLVDTNLHIIPSEGLTDFLKTIKIDDNVPLNIIKLVEGKLAPKSNKILKQPQISLSNKDIENINIIKELYKADTDNDVDQADEREESKSKEDEDKTNESNQDSNEDKKYQPGNQPDKDVNCLETSDIDWLYSYLQEKRQIGEKNVPYLHTFLEESKIELPKNQILKRNPDLEARCVKLRAQQEAREYRKMTKTVDNVRMRFPEDSIAYQMKQINRQLIAIGQFIISIFAGFLFGFRGIEWIVGHLDIGFRLLLGVMCALIIALAEIYFLAKKLNEELNIPEPVQLGGPTKFADDEPLHRANGNITGKEHQE